MGDLEASCRIEVGDRNGSLLLSCCQSENLSRNDRLLKLLLLLVGAGSLCALGSDLLALLSLSMQIGANCSQSVAMLLRNRTRRKRDDEKTANRRNGIEAEMENLLAIALQKHDLRIVLLGLGSLLALLLDLRLSCPDSLESLGSDQKLQSLVRHDVLLLCRMLKIVLLDISNHGRSEKSASANPQSASDVINGELGVSKNSTTIEKMGHRLAQVDVLLEAAVMALLSARSILASVVQILVTRNDGKNIRRQSVPLSVLGSLLRNIGGLCRLDKGLP